ncbi:MAG TPA: DUF2914 domain-containing protein [Vicinamibacterales bacterium]|nr:DUF2914 domain-containing protein [Vicinamibacterales bacterium]
MPEPREARSIVEQAEQAAAAGNYASAEDLLREAAALQERTLGAQHPDLANTLNNLGIVCEITDNPIDAEHYFRRAHAIAAATLAPDHPFVATSRKNLHDFCTARGRPVELPPSPPAVAAWLEAPAPAAPRREPSPSAAEEDAPPPVGKKSLRPLALGGLGGVALLIVIVTMVRPWGGAGELKGRPEGRPLPAEGGPLPPPSPAPSPAEPIAQPQPTATAAQPTRGETEAAGGARPATTERSTAMPTVVAAQLCTALANWRCETADNEVPPGPMFFFTQVKSDTATTIEHRWYQGDRLHRAVPLRIQANPGAGYRTYSRTTVNGAGDWRVELRSADGTVLHEERFTAR